MLSQVISEGTKGNSENKSFLKEKKEPKLVNTRVQKRRCSK